MAIVHVAMKSSASAPPSAAHADYIARAGKYEQRGDVVHVEPGNMPEFAEADPRAFWQAADAHERANGRAYTELQIALPRELSDGQRIELAQEAAREFMETALHIFWPCIIPSPRTRSSNRTCISCFPSALWTSTHAHCRKSSFSSAMEPRRTGSGTIGRSPKKSG